jgi:serine/threonine-protein kinase
MGSHDYDAAIECLRVARLPLEIGLLAAAYARTGKRPQAEKCVAELHRLATRQYITPMAEALAAIGLKDFDLAFRRLDEAIDDKTNFVNLLAVEPFFHSLQSDYRFARLLRKLNLSA